MTCSSGGCIITLLFIACSCCAETTKSYPVTTFINAKWQQTPLYMEMAEYLADINAGTFWSFIQKITQHDRDVLEEFDSEQQRYNAALQVIYSLVGPTELPMLNLVVALHSLTPRIQTHFQLADEVISADKCNSTSFAQINGALACSLKEIKKKLALPPNDQKLEVYAFDHVYPGSEQNKKKTVILYTDIGSREFVRYHKFLSETVNNGGNVRYILRHYLHKRPTRRVRLAGYGVELHLKSTEYKSQDDTPKPHDDNMQSEEIVDDGSQEQLVQGLDFKVLKERHIKLAPALENLRQSLLKTKDEIEQLKAWEFQDLGLQAAAAITKIGNNDEALQMMQFIANNFPMQARALLAHKVTEDYRNEVKKNMDTLARSLNVIAPDGALFVNGLYFDADTMDLNALVETLRTELRVLESLNDNNIRGALASQLLSLNLAGARKQEFAIDIRDTAIQWINDIAEDAQYRHWPKSVSDLLRPSFPGMMRNVRKNLFNLVLVFNPLQPAVRANVKLVEYFLMHSAPIRWGLVFDARNATEATNQDYIALTCAFNYIVEQKNVREALSFLTSVYDAIPATEPVRYKDILRVLLKKTDLKQSVAKETLEEDSSFDFGRKLAREFIERLGRAADDQTPVALLNGVPLDSNVLLSEHDFEETIIMEIMQLTQTLKQAVFQGELTDDDNVMDYLMNQPHVMPRLNQRILNTEQVNYIDVMGSAFKDLENVAELALLTNRDMTATLMSNLKYFEAKHATEKIGAAKLHFQTLWICADLDEPMGRELLSSALEYMKAANGVRVAFLPNTENSGALDVHKNLNSLVWAAMLTLPSTKATEVVLNWLQKPDDNKRAIPAELYEIIETTELHLKMLRVYAQRVLGVGKSERIIVANTRLLGPLAANEHFTIEDYGLLDRYSALQYGDKIRKLLLHAVTDVPVDFSSDRLLKLYASLLPRESKTRFKLPEALRQKHSVLLLPPKTASKPHFEITVVVDPASRAAQKLATILLLLRNTLNCEMRVILTPVAGHSDLPVKNFYRYVVESEVQFTPAGALAEGPQAKFTGLPENSLLTQHLQVPENWLVEAVYAVHDLDNIKLAEIGGPVHSEFELEYLLLEGHCFDAQSGQPPRGLQLTLGTEKQPTLVDTIVMANLGYFQLKANPGAWSLRLREGKSADIYDITHAEGTNTLHNGESTQIVINSLRSHVIKLRVAKKPGMQNADLLADNEHESNSIWNSITNTFGGGGTAAPSDEDTETINIFSLASGHLYERLLRIMMLSVLKHTKSPVKFWFLKNYLSPQFTDFLPHMAKEYNFKYELVQYKWPRWLHQQTEKQRTIWGYKILFLDVLFPLNVRKIIFVDADAIVRTDIKELYDMDLEGAPYAYTPFCDSRKEMEGFRFWKQGYWRNHLMGRRYHISALYVVDLKRFRRIAAGDRLRGQYQALSQDPNSLSNLDQDLPNNMIHQVAVKSLPDEWLWCQTWCSDSSFKKAKVIDLCNNPQTKEAKLTAAQRIVPEWKGYDEEIKRLMARLEDHQHIEHETTTTAASTTSPETTKTKEAAEEHEEL